MNTTNTNDTPATGGLQAQSQPVTPPRAPPAPLASPFRTPNRPLVPANRLPQLGTFPPPRSSPHLESNHNYLSGLAGSTAPHTPIRQQDPDQYHLARSNWSEPVRKTTTFSYPVYSNAHVDNRTKMSNDMRHAKFNSIADQSHQAHTADVQGQQYPVHPLMDTPTGFASSTGVAQSGSVPAPSSNHNGMMQGLIAMPDSNTKRKHEDEDDDQARPSSKKKANGPAYIDVDHSLAPSNFVKVDDKNPPKAAESPFPTSADFWPTDEQMEAYRQSMLIKPQPEGGDKGLPNGPDREAKIRALVKRIYDALTFTKYYWGSKAPLNRFLNGEVTADWVRMRSKDVVTGLIQFHTTGLPPSWNILESKSAATKDVDFQTRFEDVEKTLKHSKDIAMDIVLARSQLLWAVLLSPKSKFEDKNAYKTSNDGRGASTKVMKEEAKQLKKLKEQQHGSGGNGV